MPTPTLVFNPATLITSDKPFVILDSAASVVDGGNQLGAIRLALGDGLGLLGVVVGGSLTAQGTIGSVAYLYEPTKRLLSLTSATATGADFTQVLRLVGYSQGGSGLGSAQTICVNLGLPIYSIATGHYYEISTDVTGWNTAKTTAAAKTFLGLTGYLATITSAAEGFFLFDRLRSEGWVSGSSAGTSGNSVWSWNAGPELGSVFWNGDAAGSAPAGKYTNWASGSPNGSAGQPYVYFGNPGGNLSSLWVSSSDGGARYFIEYSTATGTGDDGLSGTRLISSITFQSADAAAIASLVQATTAIEISLVNGVVTNTIGVPMGSVTIGAANETHIQVSINLGVNTGGKRRQAQGFRLINGSERDLVSTRTRVGEVYNFVFLKTVDGSNSVNLLLN